MLRGWNPLQLAGFGSSHWLAVLRLGGNTIGSSATRLPIGGAPSPDRDDLSPALAAGASALAGSGQLRTAHQDEAKHKERDPEGARTFSDLPER